MAINYQTHSKSHPQLEDQCPNTFQHPSPDHIKDDLSVQNLNNVHGWLRLAGLPIPPRPLNYQRAKSREIIICENTDLHLVWAPGRIFLKPLPDYLLKEEFWQEHLVRDQQLYGLALGLLQSYVALIQYRSDFSIAQGEGLVNKDLKWDEWVSIVAKVLAQPNPKINKRYIYGELRLSRLNKIFWAHGQLRGYHFPYQTSGEMLTAIIAPVAGATVYVALVLTAMQVGLATHVVRNNDAFHNASYGFAVFSILAPIGFVVLVLFLILVHFFFDLMYSRLFPRR
ncbi:hypothetical protein P885DRAFT_68411 [Corynascus similis CBS 632.67]